jgi:hypothetical protein
MKVLPYLSFSTYEGSIIWRFLDGVSTAVSNRMLRGSPPGEENLTFLLCELLDESTAGLHVLEYPLASAKADLEKSDAGITIDVEFQTHEHPRWVEAKYSGADLGIVFVMDHPLLGYSRRAVLVQAKRLFGAGRLREFSIYSEYEHYKVKQAAFLQELEQRFDVGNAIFYLWYNPPSTAFTDEHAKRIRSYESIGNSLWPWRGRFSPFIDDMIDFGFPLPTGRTPVRPEDEENSHVWRERQPALRVSGLSTVLAVAHGGQQPQLETFYKALLENGRHRWDRFVFAPFAEFFLMGLMSQRIGSSDDEWIKLAQGNKIPMPPVKDDKKSEMLAQLDSPPAPRHTITFTVRSTLPPVG